MVPDLRSLVDLVVANIGLSVLPEHLCNEALTTNKMVKINLKKIQLNNIIYIVSPQKVRQNQRVKFVKNFILNIPK